MKPKTMIAAFCMLMLAVTGVQCDKTGGDGGVFLPDLSLSWINKADASNSFFFLVAQTGVATTTFTGNENPIGGGAQFRFSGSVNERNIQFTYDNNSGVKSNKSYTGTLNDASNTMTLTSSTMASIVLEKR
jgi:hypothetical protein